MARIIQDDQGSGSSGEGHLTVIQADGQTHIQLPDADFMAKGEILRDGQDLILQSSDGTQVVVENYFSAMPAPLLTTPHGSMLTPDLVESFVKTHGNAEYAANATANDASAVGLIKEVSGDATITRADGSSEKIVQGMEVHQGDIVETADKGAVNIVFIDESSFSISENARLAIDEYVFDPSTQAGETNVSILRGMFVFTSGLIGRDDPDDVKIETPVGSIGIRGTTIAGDIQPDGESKITVVEGAIVIANGTGEVTLSDQYQTVTLTGFESQIQMAGTLDAGQMRDSYGMLGTVNAGFFNTLNDDAPANEDQPAPQGPEAPADTPANPNESKAETQQPVIAESVTDDSSANFEAAATNKSDTKLATAADTRTDTKADAIADTATKAASSTHNEKIAGIIANIKAAYLASLPVDLRFDMFVIDDGAAKDSVVGRAYTTVPYDNAKVSFVTVPVDPVSGKPMFYLDPVDNAKGIYEIKLSSAGVAYMRDNHILNESLGNIQIKVEVGNRSDVEGSRAYVGNTDGRIAVFADMHLNDLPSTSSPSSHDGYVYNDGSSGHGYSAAYIGRNGGSSNFIVTENERNIASNGDINGDGFMDHIIGATSLDTALIYSGAGGAPRSFTWDSGSQFGNSVAAVDFNGDGYTDVFAAAPLDGVGSVKAVWGDNGLDIANTGSGFTIAFDNFIDSPTVAGGAPLAFGSEMTSLRDFNGDGYGDLAISYQDSSDSQWYVTLYRGNENGSPYPFGPPILVGPTVNGDTPLFDMGDVNGDGLSDLMIGNTTTGGSLKIYNGAISPSITSPSTTILTDTTHHKIIGGGSVGDFNGDGYDDIFVATRNVGGNGTGVDAYIVYGSSSLPGTLMLTPEWASTHSDQVFHMTLNLTAAGVASTDLNDFRLLATAIGDQNGDGLDDVLLSSDDFDNGQGGYYVVYGQLESSDLTGANPRVHVTGANNAITAANSNFDSVVGNSSSNVLSDAGHGGVNFNAGAGNDIIHMYSQARGIDGGAGFDQLKILNPTANLNLNNISHLSGIEKISFMSGSGPSLELGLNDVFSLLQTSSLNIDAGCGTRQTLLFTNEGSGTKSLVLDAPGGGTSPFASTGQTVNYEGQSYALYTHSSGYQLLIDNDSTSGIAVTVA